MPDSNTNDTYSGLLVRGNEALANGNWQQAKELFEQSVSLNRTPEALEQLGLACWWVNDEKGTIENREAAFALYCEQGDNRSASRLASWLVIDYMEYRGEAAVANGWLQRARTLLEPTEPSAEYALYLSIVAHVTLMVNKDPDAARKIGREAIEVSRSQNAPDVEMLALGLQGLAMVSEGDVTDGMHLLDEATTLALNGTTKDQCLISSTCCYMIHACERARDFDRAEQWCAHLEEYCRRWRLDSMFATCKIQYATVLLWRGLWEQAETEFRMAEEMFQRTRPALAPPCLIRIGEIRRRQGRWEEAERMFSTMPSHSITLLGRSALALDRDDDPISAQEFAERYLRRIPEVNHSERANGLEFLLRAYIRSGNLNAAKRECVEPLGTIASIMNTDWHHATHLYCAGLLADAEDRPEEAKRLFEESIDRYEQSKTPYECAIARREFARVCARLGRVTVAVSELESALTAFRTLGAVSDAERTTNLLSQLSRQPAPSVDTGLTARELDVLRLIVAGKDNERIAEELFLSIRTVERHISNIYQKIGATGKSARASAVAYAFANNVLSEV